MLNIDIVKEIEEYNERLVKIKELKFDNYKMEEKIVDLFGDCISYYANIEEKIEFNKYLHEYFKNLLPVPNEKGAYRHREFLISIDKILSCMESLLSKYLPFYINKNKNDSNEKGFGTYSYEVRYLGLNEDKSFKTFKNDEIFSFTTRSDNVWYSVNSKDRGIIPDLKWVSAEKIYNLLDSFIKYEINIFEFCETICKTIYDKISKNINKLIDEAPNRHKYSIKIVIDDYFRYTQKEIGTCIDYDMMIRVGTMLVIDSCE